MLFVRILTLVQERLGDATYDRNKKIILRVDEEM